jgi:hypothetical protein
MARPNSMPPPPLQGAGKPPELTESDILNRDLQWYQSMRERFDHIALRLRNLPHTNPNELQSRVVLAAENPDIMALEQEVFNAYRDLIESLRQCRRAVDLDWNLSSALIKSAKMRRGELPGYMLDTSRDRVMRSLDERNMEVDEIVWDLEQVRVRGEGVGAWWGARGALERVLRLRGVEGVGEGQVLGIGMGMGMGGVGEEDEFGATGGGGSVDLGLGMGVGENLDGV